MFFQIVVLHMRIRVPSHSAEQLFSLVFIALRFLLKTYTALITDVSITECCIAVFETITDSRFGPFASVYGVPRRAANVRIAVVLESFASDYSTPLETLAK